MKLKFNHGGATDAVNLYSNPPSMHRLAVRRNNQTYYAKLGEVNHPDASALHVRRNGKTFAAIKNYNPLTFDECGNTWTKSGSPTITTDNAIFGTAGYFPRGVRLQCNAPLIAGGRDFSFDFYASFYTEDADGVLSGFYAYFSRNLEVGFTLARNSVKLGLTTSSYFATNTSPLGTRHHYAFSYIHETGDCYLWLDGTTFKRQTCSLDSPPTNIRIGAMGNASNGNVIIDEFRILDGIALWTAPFTPPTEPYEVDEYTTALLHF